MNLIVIALLLASVFAIGAFANNSTKRNGQAACAISAGCTNSDVALTNGKIMYSNGGAIVENPYLQSTGGNLKVVASGVSITPQSPAMINLVGTSGSQSTGPHIQTYCSADNYPLFQLLSYDHNNTNMCFDCYWSGSSWLSSAPASYFRFTKSAGSFDFQYGSGASQGSAASFTSAVTIDTAGMVTMPKAAVTTAIMTTANISTAYVGDFNVMLGLTLPTFGYTAAILDYYATETVSVSFTGSVGGSTLIDAVRIGNAVTLTIRGLTNTATGAAYSVTNVWSYLDHGYYPYPPSSVVYTAQWPVYVKDNGVKLGMVEFVAINGPGGGAADYAYIRIYSANGGGFSVGNDRGWGDISISYTVPVV